MASLSDRLLGLPRSFFYPVAVNGDEKTRAITRGGCMKIVKTLLMTSIIGIGMFLPSTSRAELQDAVDVDWNGYYRVRGIWLNDVNGDDTTNATSFIQHRLRLNPVFHLMEDVSVHVVGDLFNSPSLSQVDQNCAGLGTCADQGLFGSGGNVLSLEQDRDLLDIRRAWGEVKTPFGLFKIGRQPSNWGLGILTNSGDELDDDFGDTADRIQWIGQFGDLYVSLLYEKLLENEVTRGGDDVDDYILAALYERESYEGGLWFVFRKDPVNETDIYIIDLYGKGELSGVTLSGEVAFYTGDSSDDAALAVLGECAAPGTDKCDLTAVNAVLRAEYPIGPWDTGLEFGVSTGDDNSADSDVESIEFNADYDVALILFQNHPVSSGTQLGPVQNVWYAKPSAVYNLTDRSKINLAGIYGRLLEQGTANDEQVGFELDAGITHDLNSHVQVGLDVGHLISDDGLVYFSAANGRENVTTVQGRAVLQF